MTYTTVVDWETSATTQPTKTKRRTRASAPASYPIFGEAAKTTSDQEWVVLLLKAEKGQFPAGFSYAKDTMWYRGRNGGEDVKMISTIDPEQFFQEIRAFMSKHGIVTKLDKTNASIGKIIIDGDDWLTMPTRYRQAVICKFVETERVERSLSHSETMQLYCTIRTGTLIGAFDKMDFSVEKFTLKTLNKLLYDPDKRKYMIDPTFVPATKQAPKTKSTTKSPKSYDDYWNLFLKSESDRLIVSRSAGIKRKPIPIPISTESENEDNSSTL